MKETGGTAFPSSPGFVTSWEGTQKITTQVNRDGMTLRDWFAGQALAGMLANGDHFDHYSMLAYRHADEMIAEGSRE